MDKNASFSKNNEKYQSQSIYIFFEIDEILPKNIIPRNDSFTLTIKYKNKQVTELFPISSVFTFKLNVVEETVTFMVFINKGPLVIYKGEIEINKLVFLNKEVSEHRSFPLVAYESNTKLFPNFQKVSNLKCNYKYIITYNEKEKKEILMRYEKMNMLDSQNMLNVSGIETNIIKDNHDLQLEKSNCESSLMDVELNETDGDDENMSINEFESLEKMKFKPLITDLSNSLNNFINLPCTKFSILVAEKFFKMHNKYTEIISEYSKKYYRYKDLANKYNEKFRIYSKKLNVLKKNIKEIDDKLIFQIGLSNHERSSITGFHNIMKQQQDFFQSLFKNYTKKIENNEIVENEKIKSNRIMSEEFKTIKAVLENLNRRPELLCKIPENKFCFLKSNSSKFNVKIDIPTEWIIDKIDEVPEHSIMSSERGDDASNFKSL